MYGTIPRSIPLSHLLILSQELFGDPEGRETDMFTGKQKIDNRLMCFENKGL
jgi:hypothetical protein